MCPVDLLEHWTRIKGGHIPQTKNSDRAAALRHMNQLSQGLGTEQGHPTHADILNTRSEPEILDGTCHRSQIHIRHGSSPEYMSFSIVAKRGDQQFATSEDALYLEAHKLVLALGQCLGRLEPFRFHKSVNACSEPSITYSDQTPGLHEP